MKSDSFSKERYSVFVEDIGKRIELDMVSPRIGDTVEVFQTIQTNFFDPQYDKSDPVMYEVMAVDHNKKNVTVRRVDSKKKGTNKRP